jgi:hypothetical protein
MAVYDARFGDLLDSFEDEECDTSPMQKPLSLSSPSHGSLGWNIQMSQELQQMVDTFAKGPFSELEFSVTVADPMQPDCPLIACSIGFTDLTGYCVHEIVGRNCRFLLNGVTPSLIDDQTRLQCRSFLNLARENSSSGPFGDSSKDDLLCVQTNATKSGELFRNMFYLKNVELDDKPFILALQSGVPEGYEEETGLNILQAQSEDAWAQLDANMAKLEQVLAAQFWFQADMRRQLGH